jgi:hypothetical protein
MRGKRLEKEQSGHTQYGFIFLLAIPAFRSYDASSAELRNRWAFRAGKNGLHQRL